MDVTVLSLCLHHFSVIWIYKQIVTIVIIIIIIIINIIIIIMIIIITVNG